MYAHALVRRAIVLAARVLGECGVCTGGGGLDHLGAASRGKADVIATRQFTGTRRGLLRPRRAVLFSQKAWRLIASAKWKGFELEVAHLV